MNMGKVEASERAEFDSSLIDPGRMLNQAETPEDKKYSADSWFFHNRQNRRSAEPLKLTGTDHGETCSCG